MGYASHPLLALSAMIWMLVPSAAAQDCDQSLDTLVRLRIITFQERELLRGGGSAFPMDRSRFQEAFRNGCLVQAGLRLRGGQASTGGTGFGLGSPDPFPKTVACSRFSASCP